MLGLGLLRCELCCCPRPGQAVRLGWPLCQVPWSSPQPCRVPSMAAGPGPAAPLMPAALLQRRPLTPGQTLLGRRICLEVVDFSSGLTPRVPFHGNSAGLLSLFVFGWDMRGGSACPRPGAGSAGPGSGIPAGRSLSPRLLPGQFTLDAPARVSDAGVPRTRVGTGCAPGHRWQERGAAPTSLGLTALSYLVAAGPREPPGQQQAGPGGSRSQGRADPV